MDLNTVSRRVTRSTSKAPTTQVSDVCGSLEYLPVEIQLLILTTISEANPLSALVHGSPAFHRAYRAYRREILSQVLFNQITQGGGSLLDPIAALCSDSLHFRQHKCDRKGLVPFMDRYNHGMFGYQDLKGHCLDDCFALLRLERMADYLSCDFCKSAVSEWSERKYQSYPGNAFQLSLAERRRLKRAVYRWQIHYNLFGIATGECLEDDDVTSDVLDGINTDEDDARLFLLLSRPWEIEEIASFANYAFERYQNLITGKELRKDFVPSSPINNAIMESDFPIKGYCDHFLSLGPSFLFEVLSTSDPEKRSGLLIQNADQYELQSLELLLAWPRREPNFGPQSPKEKELELQGLQFRGDDFQTSSNAG